MRCLVTGGTGFIGGYTCRALTSAGHDVVAFDLQPHGNSSERSQETRGAAPPYPVEAGDILDQERLLDVLRRYRIDTVIHLAAILTAESFQDPVTATRVNCEGTAAVFESARLAGVERVVWASSVSVYYGLPREAPITPDTPHRPADIYGASKSFCEQLGMVYARHFGLANIGLRLGHGTGAGRLRGGGVWARELIDKPALGEPSVLDYGDEMENWLSVEDQAEAILAACTSPLPAEEKHAVYIVAGFDNRTRREAAEYVSSLLPDARIEVRPGKRGLPYRFDTEAMAAATGWRARFGMKDMLRDMINRVRRANGLPPVG